MRVFDNVDELRAWRDPCRAAGEKVGFIPTMGALHAGHLSLVKRAREENDRVVVSIFVNPTQFGPGEDFEVYPRVPEADRALLEADGVDALFLPPVEAIYPEGAQTGVTVSGVSLGLCGESRPGHFTGVATVVTILFNLTAPDRAYFGLKDYQQFAVICRMVKDLAMPVEVVGLPTVREPDGLAMSSRNARLTPDERETALALNRGLTDAEEAWSAGEREPAKLEGIARAALAAAGIERIDYVTLREAETLAEAVGAGKAAVLLIAAHVGSVRLIDNRTFRT